jgi:hypothetical protein
MAVPVVDARGLMTARSTDSALANEHRWHLVRTIEPRCRSLPLALDRHIVPRAGTEPCLSLAARSEKVKAWGSRCQA